MKTILISILTLFICNVANSNSIPIVVDRGLTTDQNQFYQNWLHWWSTETGLAFAYDQSIGGQWYEGGQGFTRSALTQPTLTLTWNLQPNYHLLYIFAWGDNQRMYQVNPANFESGSATITIDNNLPLHGVFCYGTTPERVPDNDSTIFLALVAFAICYVAKLCYVKEWHSQ